MLGIAGAIFYSFKSGRDLREVFETVKSDIEQADFDALGQQLEARIGEMQATLEERINEVKANAQPVLDGAGEQIGGAVTTATDAINKARGKADSAADEAGDVADDLADTVGDAADDAADAATDLRRRRPRRVTGSGAADAPGAESRPNLDRSTEAGGHRTAGFVLSPGRTTSWLATMISRRLLSPFRRPDHTAPHPSATGWCAPAPNRDLYPSRA